MCYHLQWNKGFDVVLAIDHEGRTVCTRPTLIAACTRPTLNGLLIPIFGWMCWKYFGGSGSLRGGNTRKLKFPLIASEPIEFLMMVMEEVTLVDG